MPSNIFISYRRRQSPKDARAIYERLRREFGEEQVFIDLEGIGLGEDFVETLTRQLDGCQVLVALIGHDWADAKDAQGRRGLDNPDDFVRIELRTAFKRGIRVIPILVDGAALPSSDQLPEDLRPLVRKQASSLDFNKFDTDIGRLIRAVRKVLDSPADAPSASISPVPPPTDTRMRIAFTSCMNTRVFADQPVWEWISAHSPDHLVLLGDSLYIDFSAGLHPRDMDDDNFARHVFSLYSELVAQPQFATLVRSMPEGSAHAIWDDNDFLWSEAQGAEAEVQLMHGTKLRLTAAFFEAFRDALGARLAPGSFPSAYNAAPFWDTTARALSTPSLRLADDVRLHLSDGRTHRTRTHLLAESKRTLFGRAQKECFANEIRAAPQALHLWASGSTLASYESYSQDLAWLHALAAKHRMLVLSGDMHRNKLGAFNTGGLPLHEVTSSGAAVRDAVVVGEKLQNYGLIDVEPETLTMRLFKHNALEHTRVLRRATWLPL